MADKKIMPGEMSGIDVNHISLVRKGANRQKIQIYKADEDDTQEVAGFMQVIKEFFGVSKEAEAVSSGSVQATKATFANQMAVADITDNMWKVNDTLRSVMRDIIGDESLTDKKPALLKAIDEFAAYMKDKINAIKIKKEMAFFDEPIEKSGKSISTKNLSSIRNAVATLQDLINENEKEEDPMAVNKEELGAIFKTALDEALTPITQRIEVLEKADGNKEEDGAASSAEGTNEEGGATSGSQENVADVVKSAISEALAPIDERLGKIEKSRGDSKAGEGQEEVKKEAHYLAGVL